jgi:predicted GNAT superfamily acetyltransferase
VPELTIRDLLPSDIEAATAINNANTPAVGEAGAEHLTHLLGQSVIALAAIAPGEELAGFCIVLGPGADYGSVNYRWFTERYDDFVYLDRVAVAETARNAGVGTALYAEVERRASAPWFLLEVNLRPRNDGSLRFHHRLGFTEVGQQETDYGTLVSMLAKPLG